MAIYERQYYRSLSEDQIFARLTCEGPYANARRRCTGHGL